MSVKITPPLTRDSIFLPATICYWSTRVYGVYPCTIIGDIQNGKTAVRILDRIIATVNLLLLIVVVWFNMKFDLQGIVSTSKVIEAANKLSLFAEIISTMFLTVANFYLNRDKLLKVFYKLDKFDKQYRMIFMSQGYNATEFRFFLGAVITFFVMLIFCTLMDLYVVSMEFGIGFGLSKVIYYYSVIGPHWAFMYSYILYLFFIWHRFNHLGKCLK